MNQEGYNPNSDDSYGDEYGDEDYDYGEEEEE